MEKDREWSTRKLLWLYISSLSRCTEVQPINQSTLIFSEWSSTWYQSSTNPVRFPCDFEQIRYLRRKIGSRWSRWGCSVACANRPPWIGCRASQGEVSSADAPSLSHSGTAPACWCAFVRERCWVPWCCLSFNWAKSEAKFLPVCICEQLVLVHPIATNTSTCRSLLCCRKSQVLWDYWIPLSPEYK